MVISAQDAQAMLIALLDGTQALLPGEWQNHDSPSPDPCQLDPQAPAGIAYTGDRTRDAGGDLPEPEVAALWRAAGLEVGRTTVGEFEIVRGVDPGNRAFFAELHVGATTTTLRGQSPCVPGDAWTEHQKVKRDAAAAK